MEKPLASITLTNFQTGDVLDTSALPTGTGISVDSSSTATNILLTGTGTVAQYQAAIAASAFSNSETLPNRSDRTIDVVVNDGTLPSNIATTTIQWDSDGDGVADTVDLDDDNDGVPDTDESPSGLNPDADTDGDGKPDYLDPDTANFTDTNNDGVDDRYDTDSDGIIDSLDIDSDNDGIVDVIEAGGEDVNGDRIIDNFTDSNNDGLDDATATTPLDNPDTDNDGIKDNVSGTVTSDNDSPLSGVEVGLFASDGTTEILDGNGQPVTAILEESNQILSLRDRWLEATANAANRLLATPDLDTGINAALKVLGKSLDCDRVGVVQNIKDSTGETSGLMRIIYEWNSTSTVDRIHHPKYGEFPNDGLEEWFAQVINGNYAGGTIDEVPESYVEAFIDLNIQSTYNIIAGVPMPL